MAGLGPAWPSRTLLVLPPPELISTPAEESGTSQHCCPSVQLSRHCCVLAERLHACKVLHGLEQSLGDSFICASGARVPGNRPAPRQAGTPPVTLLAT